MKQESSKNKKKWLLPVIIAAAVLVVAGILLAIFLLPGDQSDGTAQSKLYWNVDRLEHLDPEGSLSVRKPEADGLYSIRFAVDGEQVQLKCADKRLINVIDMMDLMGLVFDADGLIVDAVAPETVAKEIVKDYFVKSFDGTTLTVNSSIAMSGMAMDIPITENTGIYDVTPDAEVVGAPGELGVMDKVVVYGNEAGETTHVFRLTKAVEAEVYHRLYRKYDKVNKVSSRVPDENGVYTIEFAHKGQLVDLKCKDKALVDQIDKAYDAGAQMGLLFDDEGYIVKTISAQEAMKGKLRFKKVSVAAVDGNMVSFESRYYSNTDIGETADYVLPEDVEMYLIEADCEAHFIGEKTDHLKVGDRCYVYTDFEDNVKMIFVERRMVESKLYYNVTRMYDSTTLETTRVPDSKGYYVFTMAVDGKQVELKTKDKALATRADSMTTKTMGLKLNGNIIEEVYGCNCVTGIGVNSNRFVTDIMGGIVRIVTRDDWTTGGNYMLAPDCQIYDVSNSANVPIGSATELKPFDWIASLYLNENNQITHMYIQQRYIEDGKLVYHLNKQYDAEKQETTRVPDEQGYYVFEMLSDGKVITAKTKDKAVASYIDRQKYPVTLKLSGQIIKGAYTAGSCLKGGVVTLRGSYFQKMTKDGKFEYLTSDTKELRESNYAIAKDCTVYNYAVVYKKYRGEKTTLQKDDVIYCVFSHEDKEIHKMFVYTGRQLDAPLYWHVNRQYDKVAEETKRKPDKDGWYVFQFAVDGQIKTMKTKDKAVATKADVRSGAFSVIADGDIMVDVVTYPYTKEVKAAIPEGGTITAINGNMITVKGTTSGQEHKLTLANKCKIYNVSPSAKQFGSVDTIAVGDKIAGFVNDDDKVCYIYIQSKYTPPVEFVLDGNAVNNDNLVFAEGTTNALCSVCNKTVTWTAVTTDADITEAGHYYLAGDIEATDANGLRVISSGAVCLHLNGHNISNKTDNSNLTAVTCGSGVLTILGKGTVHADNKSHKQGGAGAVVADCENTVVNLCGGTYTGYGASYSALGTKNGATIKIYKGVTLSGGNMGIYGDATYEIYGGALTSFFRSYTTGVGTVVIKAGSINSTTDYLFYNEVASATITGGVFNQDPSKWVPEGCDVVKSAGFWYVGDDVNKAPSGGDQPSEAFDPATTVCKHCNTVPQGGWIKIKGNSVAEITADGHYYLDTDWSKPSKSGVTLPNYNICLHLNGHSITGGGSNGRALSVDDGQTVNVMGSGYITTTGTGGAIYCLYGSKVNVYGGVLSAPEGQKVFHINGEGSAVNVFNCTANGRLNVAGGTLKITGGTFNANPSAFVAAGYAATNNGDGTWTVAEGSGGSGGEQQAFDPATTVCEHCGTAPQGGWKEIPAGTAVVTLTESGHYYLSGAINGASGTNASKGMLNIPEGVTVCLHSNGQQITNTRSNTSSNHPKSAAIRVAGTLNYFGAGTVVNNSGTTEYPSVVIVSGGSANIFGGTFSNFDPSSYVATGYAAVDNGDGTWTVAGGSGGSGGGSGGESGGGSGGGSGGEQPGGEPGAFDPATTVCEHCGTAPAGGWKELAGGSSQITLTEGGHYYLSGEISGTTSGMLNIASDIDVCLYAGNYQIKNSRSYKADMGTKGVAIKVTNGGTLNYMGDGLISGMAEKSYGAAILVDNGTVNLYGGKLENRYGDTATANGDAFYAVRVDANGGTVTMHEGVETADKIFLYGTAGDAAKVAALNIMGGTYTNPAAIVPYATGNTAVTITGGTFSFDPTAYAAVGATVTDNGDGTWIVSASGLVRACEHCGGLKVWKELAGGSAQVKLTEGGHYYLSGEISGTTSGMLTIASDIDVCLYAGNYQIKNSRSYKADMGTKGVAVMVSGGGTLNYIGTGLISGNAASSYGAALTVNNGTVNLYGGKLENRGGDYAVRVDANGGTVTMHEGVETADKIFLYGTAGDAAKVAALNIMGGTYTNPAAIVPYATGNTKVTITGGTFSFNPSSEHVAEGYAATKDGDVWTVAASASSIAEGYEITENDALYTVAQKNA